MENSGKSRDLKSGGRSAAASVTEIAPPESKSRHPASKPRKRRRFWRYLGVFLLVLVVAAIIARALLPWAVRDYVNRTLDRSPLYTGKIGDVQIHLWRGAYSIYDVRISKTSGDVPVPFFAAKQVDFAILWKALLHHRVVGRVLMDQPEINFVDAPGDADSQNGAGGAWLQMIRDLFPFKINTAIIQNGSVHFRAYQKKFPVDVYAPAVRWALTFGVPIAVMTSFPAKALLGVLSPAWAVYAFVLTAALLALSGRYWSNSVARYTSSSS